MKLEGFFKKCNSFKKPIMTLIILFAYYFLKFVFI
jgi:hypothetical protein